MKHKAGKLFKWLYCLTLLASIFPSGLFASSSWAALALGGGWMRGGLLLLLLWLIPFVYRIFLVIRYPSTLDAFVTGKLVKTLRFLSILFMVVGVLGSLAILFVKPLAMGIFGQPGDAGIAYFVTGIFFYFISSVGLPSIILFEVSRLISFEEKLRGV